MNAQRTTLSAFLSDPSQGLPKNGQLADLLLNIADTSKAIAKLTEKGALIDMVGKLESQNIQGETQMKLDVESNQIFIDNLTRSGLVAGLASEEMEAPVLIADDQHQGAYLAIFDPLDGSSNVAVNVSVGSIFSVLHAPAGKLPAEQDYLQTGRKQVAAGYAIYGPCTMLVITVGKGTHGFTLDRDTAEFYLTHANIQIPEDTAEFAINASNERYWEPPVQRYISECRAGVSDNSREKNFNMRWIASMVADIHRILMRGGIYMYPKDNKDAAMPGRLRLMYEANPMSMIVEQAGGLSSTGRVRIQDIDPEKVHQRVPVIMGSKNEVLRVESYHQT